MIVIQGNAILSDQVFVNWQLSPVEREVLRQLAASRISYAYGSEDELRFELALRQRIVDRARRLSASGARFTSFARSTCNDAYWERTEEGGFRLRAGASPSAAVTDIYLHGRLYGFECATAIVIVLYGAVLDQIGADAFNRYFQSLYLYSWEYDRDLGLESWTSADTLAGDCQYFDNPDYEEPQWQGENAVYLGSGLYYGHGIGISTKEDIIRSLNMLRKPGSTRSASLKDQATRPGFRHLYRLAPDYGAYRSGVGPDRTMPAGRTNADHASALLGTDRTGLAGCLHRLGMPVASARIGSARTFMIVA